MHLSRFSKKIRYVYVVIAFLLNCLLLFFLLYFAKSRVFFLLTHRAVQNGILMKSSWLTSQMTWRYFSLFFQWNKKNYLNMKFCGKIQRNFSMCCCFFFFSYYFSPLVWWEEKGTLPRPMCARKLMRAHSMFDCDFVHQIIVRF